MRGFLRLAGLFFARRFKGPVTFTLPEGFDAPDLPLGLRALVEPSGNGHTLLRSEAPLVHVQMLGDWAESHRFDLPDLEVRRPTLEDVYLSLTASAAA